MDIGNILAWIVDNAIDGEYLGIIDVPDEGDENDEQNEKWWMQMIGACPPHSIPAGRYLYFYTDCISEYLWPEEEPDAEIDNFGVSIYLYKIE